MKNKKKVLRSDDQTEVSVRKKNVVTFCESELEGNITPRLKQYKNDFAKLFEFDDFFNIC